MSSSKSVPKIVIKARPSSQAGPSRGANPSKAEDYGDAEEDERNDDGDDVNDQSMMDVDQQEEPLPEVESDKADEDHEEDEEDDEEEVVAPIVRKRGRPRGRGRGGGLAGSNTPRGARGRGRGRGKGRGRGGITLKLPRKGDEDDDGAEGDNEGDFGEDEYYVAAKPSRKIQGATYLVEGDELVTDDDPKGDEKIDKNGILLGGRKFKATTFILPNRHPERQYMLAIDAARTSGFRDSLYYFRRNPLALKLNATQPEKDYLIAEGKLGSHLRTRSVTLITARSAYKLHGAKMITDGKWVTDDYYEEKALAEISEKGFKAGEFVGELPDPTTHNEASALGGAGLGGGGGSKADRGAGGIYRAGGPTTIFGGSGWGPFSDGPLNAVRKSLLSRDNVTEENWMLMMAARVREADEEWAKWRQEARKVLEGVQGVYMGDVVLANGLPARVNVSKSKSVQRTVQEEEGLVVDDGGYQEGYPKRKKVVGFETETEAANSNSPFGVYDPHSNLILYRNDTQPTGARWVPMPDDPSNPLKRSLIGGTKVGNGAWGLAWVDTIMEFPQPDEAKGKDVRLPAGVDAQVESPGFT